MSAPFIPPALEPIGQRPFSFFPPILNVQHNEWRFVRVDWSEILVSNTKSSEEIWIPRRFIGELSRIEEPVMILGLTKELEYKGGQVWPHVRRIIEMPRAVNDGYHSSNEPPPAEPAPVVGIRLESGAEGRIGKLILVAMAGGVLACVLIVGLFRGDRDGSRVEYSAVVQADLELRATDDFNDVVRKMGVPAEDRWKSEEGAAMQYRILRYPDKKLAVILMGIERAKSQYIGAMDENWRPVHSVTLPDGRNTLSMLRSLRPF